MAAALLLLGSLLMGGLPAHAHKASDSYLALTMQGNQVTGQWDIALRDIDFAIGLDANGDGEIRWGELRARHTELAAWALNSLSVNRGGACALSVVQHQVDSHTDGAYAVLRLAGTCPSATAAAAIDYRLLFDVDTLHRGLLRLELDGLTHSSILSPERSQQRFDATSVSRWAQFSEFFVQGVWHIWIGFDHVLFLLALLLPVVLQREGRSWVGVASMPVALREVVWVVTSFTVAHSITLSLASLGLVSLPSRWVESAIALSVVLAAANNLYPVVGGRRWIAAFVFGLIHGFGFASVLAELELPASALLLCLVAFNVGVEAGQLAIVAVFLPLAYAMRNTSAYRRFFFVGGSLLTMALALLWLIERVFDLQLISS